jgi:transposase
MISSAEMERMMKVQEVILKAMAGSLKWWEAAEIIGVSDRTMRRWRERYQEVGYDGLYDRRKHRPSPKRVPPKTVEAVLQLYREKYFDFNVRHFHEAGSSGAATIFSALKEQLGLRLEARKGPVDLLVIDSVQKTPTEN